MPNVVSDFEKSEATPLLTPSAGLPALIDSEKEFARAISELESGVGPFAVDAERASGYKYSARAYLIQIKRKGGGLHLIDPIPFGANHPLMQKLSALLATDEFILHASTQDLPCLRELGINPRRLFDTELAGRIAGLPKVGLGPMIEALLGFSLAKEHSAVDWSIRPLPDDWLTYAALDVDLLLELRDSIIGILNEAGKLAWAEAEFASILAAPSPAPRIDPWRRTSGMHKVKKRHHLAIVRSLWIERDRLAQEVDISPGRLLSDAAICEIALASDKSELSTRKQLEKVLRTLGLRSRWFENSEHWIAAIASARSIPESQLPELKSKSDSLPPIKIWRDKFPEKYAPLSHARFNLQKRAEELSIPLENLISPEVVRRICWNASERQEGSVSEALLALGARRWQVEIAAPIIESALKEKSPLEAAKEDEPETEEAPTT